ncbi:hypothetical protein L7F22_048282 [Adiantum nelumboides]|nr:hypothetical protein [Adiantum nelumboides]
MASHCDDTPHALVVPHAAHGHAVACVLLSESLAALGFKVSLVYFSTFYARMTETNRVVMPIQTPDDRGNASIFKRITSSDGIVGDKRATYIPLNWGIGATHYQVHNRSPCSSNGFEGEGGRGQICVYVVDDGLVPGQFLRYFSVAPAVKENLFKLILDLREQGSPPTCLISDSFIPWTLQVAQHARIPRIEFWTCNAMAHLLFFNLDSLYSDGIFPIKGSPNQWKSETPIMLSHIPGLPPFPAELIPEDLRFVDSSNYFAQFFHQVNSCLKFGERILVHSMLELEPDAFKAFELQGLHAYAVGPLYRHRSRHDTKHTECMSWLSMQADRSVIYASFGTADRVSIQDLRELAMGLEASGQPFLWVLREDPRRMEGLPQLLPDGFLERNRGKGLIVSWAPQVEVLAHRAIGGFLSHCGWNSILESFWEGVPMLCCACHAEQRLNSHYVCNVWGTGLEIERTDTGGIKRSFVELSVKALLWSEEGSKVRSRVEEIVHLVKRTCQPGGESFSNLQIFYDDMRALCTKPLP